MIDPKELRIGNYLLSGGEAIQIDAAHLCDLLTSEYYLLGHTQIPITPEWLERLGFDYKEHKDILSLAIDDKTIVLAYTNPLEIELCHFYSEETTLLKHIIYVHQIQNLIFALTGQELTIKQ